MAVGALNTQLNEDLSAVEVIRAFGRQNTFADRFRCALTGWLVAANRSSFYNAFYAPALGLLAATATAILLWTGAHGSLGAAGISLGTLTAFVLLFARFFAPLINLGDQWQTVQAALAGAERVFMVLDIPAFHPVVDAPAHPADPGRPPPAGPVVRVDRVTFGYAPDQPVLHDVSLSPDAPTLISGG